MPRGRLPTVMVAVTAFERGAMTLMVLLTSFETQSCGSRAGAGDALARQSGASNAVRSGAVRSIIEDRLIGMNRPVEPRSEEHTSELQSQSNLVCRLLLEKKKKTNAPTLITTQNAIEQS